MKFFHVRSKFLEGLQGFRMWFLVKGLAELAECNDPCRR
jgi:hypothetical protein